jgi:hypothetical protein
MIVFMLVITYLSIVEGQYDGMNPDLDDVKTNFFDVASGIYIENSIMGSPSENNINNHAVTIESSSSSEKENNKKKTNTETSPKKRNTFQAYVNNDLYRGLLFPSSTALEVGNLFGNVIWGDRYGWGTSENTMLYSLAYPEASRRWYCEIKHLSPDDGYFYPSYNPSSSQGFPLSRILFINGIYMNETGLIDNQGRNLILYTLSWHFSHPFTEEQFEKLSNNERQDFGLDTTTGEIGISLGVSDKNGNEHITSVNKIKPGGSSIKTISVYLPIQLDSIFFVFEDPYTFEGSSFFPKNKECGKNMGCIKNIKDYNDYERYPPGSSVSITQDENGNQYAGGLPIGSLPTGSSQGGGSSGGFLDGFNIWG